MCLFPFIPTSLSGGVMQTPMRCHSTSFSCLPLERSSRSGAGFSPWEAASTLVPVGQDHHCGQEPKKITQNYVVCDQCAAKQCHFCAVGTMLYKVLRVPWGGVTGNVLGMLH